MGIARLGLSLSVYTVGSNRSQTIAQYSDAIEALNFSTVSPGGYGELTCVLKVADARIPRPEFSLFSRVALMDGSGPLFLGEVTDPALGLDESQGEYINLTALGAGNCLRDDPLTVAYASSSVQSIARDQLTRRANYSMPLDQDNSQIFPDNPAGSFAPAYTNRTQEEVIADLAFIASGSGSAVYDWFVYGHPINKDVAGFPTAQLSVTKRDTSTIAYQASVASRDVLDYRIIPSAERAYNVVEIDVNDNAAGGIQTKTYKDPRLAANGSQNTAPFRRRKYKRSLVGVSTINAATAQNIANTYGAQFQNATNKIEIHLKAVRDANGNPLPLQQVQAGKNIFIPDLTVRGQQLSTTPTPGVNLFYIVETRYSGDAAGNQVFTIQCDNYYDKAGAQVARLQLTADSQARLGQTTTGMVQALGAPLKGFWGFSASNCLAGDSTGPVIDFGVTLSQAPTQITFGPLATINVGTGPFYNNLSVYGANAWVTVAANGACSWVGTFQTVGNCILAVDPVAGTFDWHCEGCDTVHTALAVSALMVYQGVRGDGLAMQCPQCASVEAFNTAVTAEDATDGAGDNSHRAQQAGFIRELLPLVGLSAA